LYFVTGTDVSQEAGMALLLIQCPRTGRYISTGIETNPDSFDLRPDEPKTIPCPFCRKEHVWTRRNALLADPDQWSDVPEIEDCFILADGFRWIADLERRHG
jgi:hypothetical protein